MSAPAMPESVARAFAAFPERARSGLAAVRALIFEHAEATGAGPLTETLKWGEPAYLTEATKSGTTLRLGWKPGSPEVCLLLVNCRTNLVEEYRTLFPETFGYRGNRAVEIALGETIPEEELGICIAKALTYHCRGKV